MLRKAKNIFFREKRLNKSQKYDIMHITNKKTAKGRDDMNVQSEINYFMMIIDHISKKLGKSICDTYAYIKKYQGMAFLYECYDINHTLSTEDVVDDILTICKKNGGESA